MKTFNDGLEFAAKFLDNTRQDLEQRQEFLRSLMMNQPLTHGGFQSATKNEFAINEAKIRLLDGQAIHIRDAKTKT